jgi:hypothetical protein
MNKLIIAIAVLLTSSSMAQAQMSCSIGDTDCLRARDYLYGGAQNQEDYRAAQSWQSQQKSNNSLNYYHHSYTPPSSSHPYGNDDE